MKALALTGLKEIDIIDTNTPSILSSNEVLLKVAYAGVCGSDIHYYNEGRIGDQIIQFPFIIGHEFSAIVEKSSSDELKPGDRVAVDPALACHMCEQCLAGREHTCKKLLFLGCPGQLEGCYKEYITMPRENCFLLPSDVSLQEGVIAEPLSIACYAVSFLQGYQLNSVGILGAGPIGLSVLLALRSKKTKSIYITEKIPERLELALKLGADWAGNPNEINIVEKIIAKEYDFLDTVIECCGQQDAIDQAIDLLKPGGKLLIVGIPSVDRISFDISKVRRKEITIYNVRRQNKCVPEAIELIREFHNEVNMMITHIVPYQHSEEIFNTAANYRDGVVKALIQFSPEKYKYLDT